MGIGGGALGTEGPRVLPAAVFVLLGGVIAEGYV